MSSLWEAFSSSSCTARVFMSLSIMSESVIKLLAEAAAARTENRMNHCVAHIADISLGKFRLERCRVRRAATERMWRDPARPPLYRVLRDARGRGGGGRCGLQQLPALPGTVGAPAPPPPPAQGGNLRSQDEGRVRRGFFIRIRPRLLLMVCVRLLRVVVKIRSLCSYSKPI